MNSHCNCLFARLPTAACECCQVGPASQESQLNHFTTPAARCCLLLRLLLLEAREQLHLLSSDYAAARRDVQESITLLSRFPMLLAELRENVHLQVGGAGSAALCWPETNSNIPRARHELCLHICK